MSVKIKVQGDAELIRNLDRLPKKPYRAAVRNGLSKGASVMNKAAKAAVPGSLEIEVRDKSGEVRTVDIAKDLKQSIGHKSKSYSKDNNFIRVVGPRFAFVGKQTGLRPSKYADDIEYGTAEVSPRPFMRKAFESHKMQTLNRVAQGIREGIAKQVAKMRVGK